MMSPMEPRGRIITFYSYKGGTGRTLLLANVAWILASAGKRVLAIDWDLEAPGLHHYFHPFLLDPNLRASDGLIDMVEHFADASVTSEDERPHQEAWLERATDIRRYAVGLDWSFPKPGRLDFVPAGRQSLAYSVRVNTFDWRHFHEELGGGAFLEQLKDKLRKDYDYVLIDSRTGVSDTSGICTVQMPDRLLICFTGSEQNIRGAAAVANSVKEQWTKVHSHATDSDSHSSVQMDPQIYPLLTRVESGEKNKLDVARGHVRELFDPIVETMTRRRPEDYWRRAQVLYWPYYAYEEILAVFGDKSSYEGSLLAACETVTAFLTDDEVVHFEPPSVADRERVLARYERKIKNRRPDAIMLIAPKDYDAAESPLDELRREFGLKIDVHALNEWLDQEGAQHTTPSSPPMILAVGAEMAATDTSELEGALHDASEGGARIYALILSTSPTGDHTLPHFVAARQRIDLRGVRDIGEALIPLEFAIREHQSVDEADPRLVLRRRMRRLAVQASEWLSKDRDDSYLLVGSHLDATLDWIEVSEVTLEPLEREYIETARIKRDEAAVERRLEEAEETAARAQAQLEHAEVNRREAIDKLAEGERAIRAADKAQSIADERLEVADLRRRQALAVSQRLAWLAAVLGVIATAVGFYQYSVVENTKMELAAKEFILRHERDELETTTKKAEEERDRAEALREELAKRMEHHESSIIKLEVSRRQLQLAREKLEQERDALNAAKSDAERARRAETERLVAYLAAESRNRVSSRPQLAALLAVEAVIRSEIVAGSPTENAAAALSDVIAVMGGRPLRGHEGPVLSAEFSPDGSRVLTWSSDGTARLWNTTTGIELLTILGHERNVLGAAFNGDGSRILTWSSDGTARLWNAVTGKPVLPPLRHEDEVRGAAFNGDETRILTWSLGGTARLWDTATGEQVLVLPHAGPVFGAAFNGNGTRILTWSGDSTARLWDTATGELVLVLRHAEPVLGAAFNGDGTRILTWSGDGTAQLWGAANGEQIGPLMGHEDEVQGAAFNGDGSRILIWSGDGTARLWDSVTGKLVLPPLRHENEVQGAAFNGDGSRILTWSGDGTVQLWDAATGKHVGLPLHHGQAMSGAAFSGDGTHILTWSRDEPARLWDIGSGTEVAVLVSHDDAVNSAVFSPDGARLATTSEDWTAQIWQIADMSSGVERRSLGNLPSGGIREVRPLPAEMIEMARNVVGRNMTQLEWKSFFPTEAYCKTFPSLPVPIRGQVDSNIVQTKFVTTSEGRRCVAAG